MAFVFLFSPANSCVYISRYQEWVSRNSVRAETASVKIATETSTNLTLTIKYGENNHRTGHSLRNLCIKLDTPTKYWLMSTCQKVTIVKIRWQSYSSFKDGFKGKFKTEAFSPLDVLKNNITTLFLWKGDKTKLFAVALWDPKSLRGSHVNLTTLSITQ